MTRGCKESQRKHGNYFGGSAGERKDLLQVDGNQSRQIVNPPAANATGADANRTVTNNATTTSPPGIPAPTYYPPYPGNHTGPHHHHSHFPGYYYDGHPQDISHVDLTTDTTAYQYHDHGQLNYNTPYERPANFYHDKYNVYAGPHVNPYLAGSFASDQINEYAGTADFNRLYASEYQPPYANGFKPAK